MTSDGGPGRPSAADADGDSGAESEAGGERPTPPTDRASPVGEPVVRGDRSVTGRRADEAITFDPEDPTSLERAAETVHAFATDGRGDTVTMLRGAAAAAALVRGEGSYRAAADRAGVGVPFVRTWARVHDLPRPVRREVAAGNLAPSAAKHVARLEGRARLTVAFAAVDDDLGVREVRTVVGRVADGEGVESALEAVDVTLGRLTVELPPEIYREVRRRAAVEDRPPGAVVAAMCREE